MKLFKSEDNVRKVTVTFFSSHKNNKYIKLQSRYRWKMKSLPNFHIENELFCLLCLSVLWQSSFAPGYYHKRKRKERLKGNGQPMEIRITLFTWLNKQTTIFKSLSILKIKKNATNLSTPMFDTQYPNPRSIPCMDHSNKKWAWQLLNYFCCWGLKTNLI
jgi:hypothetical protein